MRESQYKPWSKVWTPFGLWRIDKYYIITYLRAFCIIICGLAALVAIGDLFQRFDDFVIMSRREELDFAATAVTFVRYYLTFVPQLIFQYMLPVTMLLAASIVATAAFSGPRGNNEYVVIRSTGIPVLRAFFPLLFPALMVAVLFQATRDSYLPAMVRESSSILNRLRSRTSNPTSVSLFGPDGYQTAAIGWFSPEGVGHNMILEVREAERFHRGEARLGDNDFIAYRAAAAKLERLPSGDYQWVPMEGARKQTFSTYSRREEPWVLPVATSMTPAMIERQTLGDAVSTWRDLLLLRDDNAGAKFEIHWRLADPIACCILIMWGTGLCMGMLLRGGNTSFIKAVSISMLAAGIFYGLRLAGRTLWEQGLLTPEGGAWLPIAAAAVVALPIVFWMER